MNKVFKQYLIAHPIPKCCPSGLILVQEINGVKHYSCDVCLGKLNQDGSRDAS